MNLEIIKKKVKKADFFWRYFLAIIFLSAGLFRLFFIGRALEELLDLKLPEYTVVLIIIFELSAGLLLLINKFVKYVYVSLAFFLIIALSLALIINWNSFWLSISELFIFNTNPTDWLLHFIFLLIVIFLLINYKPEKKD